MLNLKKNKNKFFVISFLRCKALILELLAAVCLVELGHDAILAAFDNFRIVKLSFFFKTSNENLRKKISFCFEVCQERHRFEILMKSFTQPLEFHVDYMVNFSSSYLSEFVCFSI